MIILVVVGIAIAALGALVAAAGIAVACMQDKGRRCAYRRPHPAVILARDVWDGLRSGTAFLPPAPCAPSHPRYGPLAATPAAGIAVVRADGVIWCGGRNLGTQPRRTPRQGPFTQVDMPALPAPEPSGPARAWDPGDGLGPDVPIARPFAPTPTWNEKCQLDVAEAERLKEAMIP